MTPTEIINRLARIAPKAVAVPLVHPSRLMPQPQQVGADSQRWTMGFLIDGILTRDPWMHPVDITRAIGREVLTAGHDRVPVTNEWATRHAQPYTLIAPAGGQWSASSGEQHIELDAVEFGRIVSGRGHGEDLLNTQLPF